MFFFSHMLALHRPTNGAAAIIPNAVPKAICITSPFPPQVFEYPVGCTGSETAKDLHIVTVDPLLSDGQTTVDIHFEVIPLHLRANLFPILLLPSQPHSPPSSSAIA
jgi:hypothetical protein